jgi:hypothetical protein
MKHRLCILLALLHGPVFAGPLFQAGFRKVLIDPGSFSAVEAGPDASPLFADPDFGRALPEDIGIFTTDIIFPDTSLQTAQGGTTAMVTDAIASDFPYEPSGATIAAVMQDPGEASVMMLEPVSVVGLRDRETAEAIDSMERMREAHVFSLVSGGRLASVSADGVDIEFGFWQHLDLIPEAPHVGEPKAVFDLLHVSW